MPSKETLKKKEEVWTAEEIVRRLKMRYGGAGYVVLEQVANGTGMYATSWIDVVVCGMYPSKGLTRQAFEIKVDRADFLKEIRDITKNAWARECFHEFWYVAPKGVIKTADEVPEGCGWLAPRGENQVAIVKAAQRKANPALDDLVVATLMRSFEKEKQEYFENIKKNVLLESFEHRKAKCYQDAVEKFLDERGVEIYSRREQSIDNYTKPILEALHKATYDRKVAQERDHVISVLNEFQRRILTLFQLFGAIAVKGLQARDEVGQHIITSWGDVEKGLSDLKDGFAEINRDGYKQVFWVEIFKIFENAVEKKDAEIGEKQNEQKTQKTS